MKKLFKALLIFATVFLAFTLEKYFFGTTMYITVFTGIISAFIYTCTSEYKKLDADVKNLKKEEPIKN